jgi:hypothetical protein
MKLITMLLLCAGGLLFAPPSQTAGRRGIVPLRPTRAEVESLIGKPNFGRGQHYDGDGLRVKKAEAGEVCE